jgi:hypothetical protein
LRSVPCQVPGAVQSPPTTTTPLPTPTGEQGEEPATTPSDPPEDRPEASPASTIPSPGATSSPGATPSPDATPSPGATASPARGQISACGASSWCHWVVSWTSAVPADLAILERSASGRVVRLRVGGRIVEGDEIRRALRFKDASGREHSLYSTAFTLEPTDSGYLIQGSGWGHGVGLCQWGARGMARAGCRYEDILALYFPGTSLGMAVSLR